MNGSRFSRRQWLGGTAASLAIASFVRGEEKASPAREVPWLAEVQRAPATSAAVTSSPPLSSLLVDDSGRPIKTLENWTRRRVALERWWLEFLRVPVERSPVAPKTTVRSSERIEGVVRELIAYETEPGLECEAYLTRPEKIEGKVPGVVCLHSTVDFSLRQPAGLEGEATLYFGLELARRGCIAISPRNFLWPETRKLAAQAQADAFHKRHPKSLGMAKMLHDSQVALDILAAIPEVDGKRLGCVGHSLGGKEVLYLAAFDRRITCAVSSEGGIATRFSNWDADWYLGPTIRETTFAHDHHELLGLIAPRSFLLVGGDSADGDKSWPYIDAALPAYELYGRPARLGLLNHRQGHKVPVETAAKIHEWLATYL